MTDIQQGSPQQIDRMGQDGKVPQLQPLDIGLEDDRLLNYFNDLEKSANEFWDAPGPEGVNLKERRKQNIKYLFGKQLLGREMKRYESEFVDNVIYEFEKMLKALAVSKMPDIIVEAGGGRTTEQKKLTAELLTKANKNRMLDRKFKKALGILFKHLPAYFTAVYKYRWDANKNKIGEIVEEVVNPEDVVLDHACLEADPDKMGFIIHYVEKTAKEWAMLFPKQEEKIKEYVKSENMSIADDKEDWLLAQKIRVAEIWFDWFDKAEDFDSEKPKFDFFSGVAWKLGKSILLGKTKNPNWDYEGHQSITLNGEPVLPEMMEQMVLTGQTPPGFKQEVIFNNYFEFPRKPFILMSFDQFLRSAIDETSRIEQVIPLQKSQDKVERQVDHMIAHHKGKHIWNSESGMDKKNLKNLDMDNPDSDVIAKGNPRDIHDFIQPVMPTNDMYQHILNRRERMFAKVGAHGATRGDITTSVATTNQIAREADFTQSDDLVDETILHVTVEIAEARLHMMKLRYTPEHWNKLLGMEEGKYLELRLDNDSIENGMEVKVTASTTDKLRAERNAQSMAQLGFTEPLSFYEDMNIPNAEERAERLFLQQTNPALYYEKFILQKDISQIAGQVIAASMPQQQQMMAGQPQQSGQLPSQAPQIPSPQQAGSPATGVIGSVRNAVGGAINGLMGR